MTDASSDETIRIPEFDAGAAPQLQIIVQYLKDLSFENYNAPQSLLNTAEAPEIEVTVNLDAQTLGEGMYEIDLTMTAAADRNDERIFMVEAVYSGLFRIQGQSEEAARLICLIECPRVLFPFARRVISDATRDGGFPPLLVEPIDFYRLYRDKYGEPGEDADGGTLTNSQSNDEV